MKVTTDAPVFDPKRIPVTITMTLEEAYQLEQELGDTAELGQISCELFHALPTRGERLRK
jgi:hypothetical protein